MSLTTMNPSASPTKKIYGSIYISQSYPLYAFNRTTIIPRRRSARIAAKQQYTTISNGCISACIQERVNAVYTMVTNKKFDNELNTAAPIFWKFAFYLANAGAHITELFTENPAMALQLYHICNTILTEQKHTSTIAQSARKVWTRYSNQIDKALTLSAIHMRTWRRTQYE